MFSAFLLVMAMLFVIEMVTLSSASSLQVGFYASTCPSAEAIVRRAVKEATTKNPGIAAGLIRMHFHDCFVRGCDASVLLDSTNGNTAEKDSPINNPSLRGFEVLDKIKDEIERKCPKTVSCSDILSFAARDSVFQAGGITYDVPSGRLDGRVSLASDVLLNLPPPSFNVTQLQQNFDRKGLSLDDMVTLSGAHSIGVSHCSSFSNRLYSFNKTSPQDPSMNPAYAAFLKSRCPALTNMNGQDGAVPLDIVSPNRLDNRYYKNLRNRKGLLASDQSLASDPSTAATVRRNANRGEEWAAKFAEAMVRMGSIEGTNGEIRSNCRVVN